MEYQTAQMFLMLAIALVFPFGILAWLIGEFLGWASYRYSEWRFQQKRRARDREFYASLKTPPHRRSVTYLRVTPSARLVRDSKWRRMIRGVITG